MIEIKIICLLSLSSVLVTWTLAQHHSSGISIPHYIKYSNQQAIPTRLLHKPVITANIPTGFGFSSTDKSIHYSFKKAQNAYTIAPQQVDSAEKEDEDNENENEKQEPDRLSQLLVTSKFDCSSRKTGYYADEGLNCEIFHYCQENNRHSWICPEGFTFHQVHLICMPPGGDNICEKSSKYYFVNDYLYKPINLEETLRHPNASIRYSERYFPDNPEDGENRHQKYQSQNGDDNDDEDDRNFISNSKKHPINVAFHSSPRPQTIIAVARPQATHLLKNYKYQPQHGQVFRSPEEINISLQQRKPILFSK